MRQFLLFFFIVLCNLQISWAQSVPNSFLKGLQPRNIGPGGMSGRITAIDVVTTNPDLIFVGTASGGVWRSKSGGISWEPIFEKEATASIGSLAIQQSNPSVIWVGTGEGNPRNSLNGGYGIYKSMDGGQTWNLMGLENTRHIHRIIIDPTDPNIVYAGAIGSPWGTHPERGVYKTTDGGQTWSKILSGNESTGVADLVIDPENPNKLIAALWEHKRDPWFFKSGGQGSGLFITYDGGKNWKQLSHKDGLPEGELGRIGLAIAPSDPDIVYALIEAKKNALYKSTDGGLNWKKINEKKDIGNRPFYYSDIFVDPKNENRVYSIFTFVNVSEDGGKNFKQLMASYGEDNGVHPDHHAWWIHPDNPSFMIDGNDGGLNITRDRGKTWRFIGSIPVAQFYHIAVDNEYPYNVYGGMQDNGSWRGPAYVWRYQGIRNSYWQEISFGDGFDVVPDPDDSQYGWSMSQEGYVNRYDWKTGNNYLVRPTHPDADVKLRFNWNSAINIDPFNSSTLYFGSQFVHKSTDKGITWTVISPDLTSNDKEKQKQSESGGLTMDATGAENYTTILVIEPSKAEQGMLWAGTDDGKIYTTQNGGGDWNDVSSNVPGLPEGSWIAQIKAHPKNKGEALLVANNYRRYDYTPYVYRTKNYGKSWTRIVDANDTKSFALSIVQDPEEDNLLFLGTDDGLYISIDNATTWQKWDSDSFPTVPVRDLVIHPREHDLVIGTFGRAAWILDDIRPLREIAKTPQIVVPKSKIHLYPAPDAYLAVYQQPSGSRFPADGMYSAQNKGYGALVSYFISKDTLNTAKASTDVKQKKSSKKRKKIESESIPSMKKPTDSTDIEKPSDSLHIQLFRNNKEIRSYMAKAPDSTGIHRLYWPLTKDGVPSAKRSLAKKKNEKDHPSGALVLPGEYTLRITYDSIPSETKITVKTDPRLKEDPKNLEGRYQLWNKIDTLNAITYRATQQLAQSNAIVDSYKKLMEKLDAKAYKDSIRMSKDISEEIVKLQDLFFGKEDKRQGITSRDTLSVGDRIDEAEGYIQYRMPIAVSSTEESLYDKAEASLKKALEKVNQFYQQQWPAYERKIKEMNLSEFQEVKTFQLQ